MVQRKEKAGTITAKIFLLLFLLLVLCLLPYVNRYFANAQIGAEIDLFTDKEPFNGKGANQSSDAFEPQELVFLRVLATYNGGPERNMLVAFQVNGPSNPVENISIIGSGTTNDTGFAEFSFRIPWPNSQAEEIIFGQWFAIATTNIAGGVVVDTIAFRVGWIVSVTELTTLSSHFSPQSVFARQDTVEFNMTVENIARIDKLAIIKVEVEDSEKNPIIHIEMESMLFPSGESYVQAYSVIPVSAVVGPANTSAAAFTASPESGGRLYSPAIFTTFTIVAEDIPITQAHDVAVLTVVPYSRVVRVGQVVDISVTVKNKGNNTESFYVTTYYEQAVISKILVTGLAPSAELNLIFEWNTTATFPNSYVISAIADIVEGETQTADNTFVDGTVTITTNVQFLLPPEWLFFFIVVIIAGIVGAILLILLLALDRIRRRRPRPAYTVLAHPHI